MLARNQVKGDPARGLTAPRPQHSRVWSPAGHFLISKSYWKNGGAAHGEKDAIRPRSGVAFSEVRWAPPARAEEVMVGLRIVDSAVFVGGGGRSEIRMAGREGVGGYRFAQKMRIKSKSVFSLAKRIAFEV